MEIDIAKAFPVIVTVLGAIAGQVAGRNKKNDAFIQLVDDLRKDYREVRDENVALRKTVEDFKTTIIELQDQAVEDRREIRELKAARETDKTRMEAMQREIDTLRSQVPGSPVPSGKVSETSIGHVKKGSTDKLPPLPPPTRVDMPDLRGEDKQ